MGSLNLPVDGADLRAALLANCLRGAFPPVDLRAVYKQNALTHQHIKVGEDIMMKVIMSYY